MVTFPFLHALGPNYEYQFVHEELDQFWRELKVPHLDLLEVYRELPPKKRGPYKQRSAIAER